MVANDKLKYLVLIFALSTTTLIAFQNCGGDKDSAAAVAAALATCDAIDFSAKSNVDLAAEIDSDTVAFTNCTGPLKISVDGDGNPQLYKNNVLVADPNEPVSNGDTLRVRLTSSATEAASYQATVRVGTLISVFVVTTADFTPAAFAFAPATGQALGASITSAQTTLAGFDGELTATVTGDGSPTILVNGSVIGNSAAVQAGNGISVRLTSAAAENTTRQAMVTIGGVSASFDVTTTGDGTSPSITSVTSPANGSYKQNTHLDFTANFTENVAITGSPGIALNIGGALKYANYLSGSGTASLIFRYTVEAATNDSDGVLAGSLQLGGGSIRDGAGNLSALLFLPLITNGVLVDTLAPSVQSSTAPANGNYSVTQNLDFALTFNESVNVAGTPRLQITVGSTTRYANYLSGTGTNALQFRYTVQPGDTDTDGIAISSTIDLNNGTLEDVATNSANVNFSPPGTTGIRVHQYPLSCKELKATQPASTDGIYTIDVDDAAGPTLPLQAYCNMSRDGGGWTAILKHWYGSGIGTTATEGSLTNWNLDSGTPYKLSDTAIRAIIGPSQNFDFMADQLNYVAPNSTGNREYVIVRNYTGYWQFDGVVAQSSTTTVMNSYRLSDNALAWTGNLQCGAFGWSSRGINCNTVLTNNPQGGLGCAINLGIAGDSNWHHIYMFADDSNSYLFVCNGAQYSSAYNIKHRWYVRER
jgi:hypothetical protein